ncbi:MAG: M23 family metallopeptidase [Leptospiraceae bacterium]|nr:M23 family metallopeptidase [Leptospiraceae bacterium]
MPQILILIFLLTSSLYSEAKNIQLKNPYEITIQELELMRLEQRDEPPARTQEKNPVPEVSKPGSERPKSNIEEKLRSKLKLSKPTRDYFVEKSFSDNPANPHRGIAIKTNSDEVFPAGDGKIVAIGQMEGYKTYIIVDHGQGVYTVYGNLDHAQVTEGQIVRKGNIIGKVSKSKSLYFQVNIGSKAVDPLKHLN